MDSRVKNFFIGMFTGLVFFSPLAAAITAAVVKWIVDL